MTITPTTMEIDDYFENGMTIVVLTTRKAVVDYLKWALYFFLLVGAKVKSVSEWGSQTQLQN